jgi:hypothetical protein
VTTDKPEPIVQSMRRALVGPPTRRQRFDQAFTAVATWLVGGALVALVVVATLVVIVRLWRWGFA